MNTITQLSGDVSLPIGQKIWWLWHNALRGIAGYGKGRSISSWHPAKVADGDASPSRKMIDAFLSVHTRTLLPQDEIVVLDIGCGTGYLYTLLSSFGYTIDYTGLDVYKRSKFDNNVPNGRFVLSKIEDFSPGRRYDLVISNTCLEHVEDDVLAVKKAFALGDLQIHIVPTFWSLPLYLWHGYRQYSPKSLFTLFGEEGRIVRLGGVFSFFIHFFFVTIPERLRVPFLLRRNKVYSWLCQIANMLDRFLPWMSVMYVIVIKRDQSYVRPG